jgi:hypothetical protein
VTIARYSLCEQGRTVAADGMYVSHADHLAAQAELRARTVRACAAATCSRCAVEPPVLIERQSYFGYWHLRGGAECGCIARAIWELAAKEATDD